MIHVQYQSMQILPCCSHYELRYWLNWCCPQTAEVQTCCLSPSAIWSLYVAFRWYLVTGYNSWQHLLLCVVFIPFQIINCFISVCNFYGLFLIFLHDIIARLTRVCSVDVYQLSMHLTLSAFSDRTCTSSSCSSVVHLNLCCCFI